MFTCMVESTLQRDFKNLRDLHMQDQKEALGMHQQISQVFQQDLITIYPSEANKVKKANTWIMDKQKDIIAAISVIQMVKVPDSFSNETEHPFVCFKFELAVESPSVSINYL